MGQNRVLELDVLRGFAILLVMGVHVPAYPIWSTIGGWGVDLFFVLSGFLISNLLFTEYKRTGDIRFKRFFFRRALKLYPSFYLLLTLTLIYCAFWDFPVSKLQIAGELLLTQNYLAGIWGHTWSLAVEEHFYVLLPLVLFYMLKHGKGASNPFQSIPYVFLGVATTCLTWRIVNSLLYPDFTYHFHYEPTHLRMDSLSFGVFLSYLHNFCPDLVRKLMSQPWRLPITLVSVVALAPEFFLPPTDPIVYTLGFTLIYIGFGTTLLLVLYPERKKKAANPGKSVRAIAWLGTYSYTLYLWHVPMAQVFQAVAIRFGMVNQYLLHAIYFGSTIIVAVLLSKLVEVPALRLRERLLPSAKPALETVAPGTPPSSPAQAAQPALST